MNSSREVKFLIAILLFIFLILVFSCREPVEGCLDVEAVNYNVAADDPCDDCCTYPSLQLRMNYQFDTLRFSYDSIYAFAGMDTRFEEVVFYLSDFRLQNETETLEVVDLVDLESLDGDVFAAKDDFAVLSPGRSIRFDLGEIRNNGASYDTLKFRVGLSPLVTTTNIDFVEEDHPLSYGIDTLWTFPEGYTYHRLTVTPDTTEADSFRVIAWQRQAPAVDIALPIDWMVSRGASINLPIRIDFKKWFSGIDFDGFTEDAIIQCIVSKAPEAFSIDEE